MSETVKLIIEIPKDDFKKLANPYQLNEVWCNRLKRMVMNGTPLDDVKKEIFKLIDNTDSIYGTSALHSVLEILDNIGKAESEDKA